MVALWLSSMSGAEAQPPNDKFSAARSISGLSGSIAGSNVGAGFQVNEPAHAGYDAAHSIWYRWTAPSTSVRAYFSTEESNFNTVLAIYTGKSLEALELVASNDNWVPGVQYSSTQFQARAGEVYWIAIDGAMEAVGTTLLTWMTNPFNDNFVNFRTLPSPQGSFTGNSTGATLEIGEQPPVAGDVTNTVWFAWAPDDSGEVTIDTIGSEFNTVLAIYKGNELADLTLVASDDDSGGDDGTSQVTFEAFAGDRYRILIGGREGAGGAYQLHWNQQVPPPSNDNFSSWQGLTGFAGEVRGANFGATEEQDEPIHGTDPSHTSVWYAWEADRAGRVCFSLDQVSAALILAVYEGEELSQLSSVAMGENGPLIPSVSACFDVAAGKRYRIAVEGKGGASGSFRLQWTFDDLLSPHNQFANALILTGFNCGGITENYYADLQPGEPLHAGDSGGKSVWFRWQAPASYKVRLKTEGSNFDTLLAVYTGKAPETGLVRIMSNDDSDGKTTSELTFDAIAGETYSIAVDGSTLQDTEPPGFGVVVLSLRQATEQAVLFSPGQVNIGGQVRIGTVEFAGLVSVWIGAVEVPFVQNEEGILATIPAGTSTGLVTLRNEEGAVRTSEAELIILPAATPSLLIRRASSHSIELSWSSHQPEFRLQSNTTLQTEAGWTQVSSVPVLVAGNLVVILPITKAEQTIYYRLALP